MDLRLRCHSVPARRLGKPCSAFYTLITVSGLIVEVVRKPIKNLHLGIYPLQGRVRVEAPLAVDDEAIRLAVSASLAGSNASEQSFRPSPGNPSGAWSVVKAITSRGGIG